MEQNEMSERARHWVRRLRSTVLSGSQAIELVAVVVLLRWADYQEAEEEAMAEFEERPWQPILPPRLSWRAWFGLPASELGRVIFHELPDYVVGLRSRSESALGAYLGALGEPLRRLAQADIGIVSDIVRWVGEQPLETSNDRRMLLQVFDALVEDTTGSREGQYVTPMGVKSLAVAIADPRPGDRVYDPCFGSGGFLTAAWEHAIRSAKGLPGQRTADVLSIFGFEVNSSAYLIGLVRLILAGVSQPHLECANSLEKEPKSGWNGQGFDVILANPPIGARFPEGLAHFRHFPIRIRDSTGLFIQHVLQQLTRQGRAVVVVPEGFLFRTGPEQELRRYLVVRGHLRR